MVAASFYKGEYELDPQNPNHYLCLHCGVSFLPKDTARRFKYCTHSCRMKAQRARQPLAQKQRQRADYYHTIVKKDPERLRKHLLRSQQNRQKVRQWLAHYKISQGCQDCGYKEHPAALQLDHTGPKSVAIADARTSIKRLQAEIQNGKCIVRCANCHSIKTWKEKQ